MRSHALFWAIDLALLGAPVVLRDQISVEIGWAMWAAAVALALYWVIANARTAGTGTIFSQLVPQWDFRFNDAFPFRRTIRLSEAGKYARDATVASFIGRAAQELSEGSANDWLITNLAMPHPNEDKEFPGPLRLYGRPPGSTRRVLIPLSERKGAVIKDGGNSLHATWSDKVLYTHLEILRSEMKRRVRYLKTFNLADDC